MNFNQPEEEIGYSGEGMGTLGQSGAAGRLRVAAGNSKKLQKDAAKALPRQAQRPRSALRAAFPCAAPPLLASPTFP